MRLLWLVPISAALVSAGEPGRAIYEHGAVAGRELVAVLRGNGVEIPGRMMACANCHGMRAEGKAEAGITVPALRGNYTTAALRRALTDGIGLSGLPLHPAMPAYRLEDHEISALAEYLRALTGGSFGVPGVSDRVLRIGIATGPRADLGDAARRVVEAAFREVNSYGGIYGRTVELIVAPTRASLPKDVFAEVASLDADTTSLSMPLVGPLSAMPASADIYTLLASVPDQAGALAEYLSRKELRRVLLVGGMSLTDDESLAAFKKAGRNKLQMIGELRPGDSPKPEVAESAQAVFYSGDGKDLARIAAAVPGIPIVALYISAGPDVFRLPENLRKRLLLAYPALLPEQLDWTGIQGAAGSPLKPGPVEALAFGAAQVLLEACKRAGRELTHQRLKEGLESMRDFRTNLIPPVTFLPGRNAGVVGAYIVTVEADRLAPLTDFVRMEGSL